MKQGLLVVAVLVAGGGLFLLDIMTPRGVASGVLYTAVVAMALASPSRIFPVVVAVSCSILTELGAFLSPSIPGVPMWVSMSNRFLSVIVIWVPVVFFLQRRQAEAALQRANEALERRVQARTKDLAEINQALVAEITERIRTEQAILHTKAQLQQVAAQLITVQDEERRRISRDLHDDVNQRLAMLAVEVDTLETRLPSSAEEVGRRLRAIQESIGELSDDVRRLAYQYHPSILDDLGLLIALRRLVDDFKVRTGVDSVLIDQQVTDPVPQEVATCLYRVAQEGLSNIARHAKASRVEVELIKDRAQIRLVVRDWGVGFDLSQTEHRQSGLGLVSMRERVSLVQGTLEIDSRPGAGTCVSVRVPLSEEPS
jgi:signal transduction histidine kinase